MPYYNNINTIQHPIGDIDLDKYVYNTIVGITTTTLVINGETVIIPSGLEVNILVRTLTGPATGVVLLGSPKNNYAADPNL